MTQFFETRMGHTFYEATMPSIAQSLKSIAQSLRTIETLASRFSGSIRTDQKADVEQRVVAGYEAKAFDEKVNKLISEGWVVIEIVLGTSMVAFLERKK